MRVTVCLATYNGAEFVLRQLDSVVKQLSSDDQIIVVDDCSKDQTVALIKEAYGERVKIFVNESNAGVIKSFEKAISLAERDYIFLCDQDDLWEDNKVFRVLETFKNEDAQLVVHDAYVVDGSLEMLHSSWNEYNQNRKKGMLGNILKNSFTGCCMAFRKDIIPEILPFPDSIEMHDQWIALVCMKNNKKIAYIDEPLMKYVRHGNNVTGVKKRSIAEQLKGRIGTVKAITSHMKKIT